MWKRMVSFKKIPSALYSSFIISTSCVLSVPGKGTKGGSSIKGVGMNYSDLQFAFSVISVTEWHPALRSPHLIKGPSGQLGHSRTLWRKASESFWHKHIFSDESLHVSLLLDNQTATYTSVYSDLEYTRKPWHCVPVRQKRLGRTPGSARFKELRIN